MNSRLCLESVDSSEKLKCENAFGGRFAVLIDGYLGLGLRRDSPLWYLLYLAIFNHQKSLKVLFDCAGKFDDYSLNDFNILASFACVLLRFWQNLTSISATTEVIFLQVGVLEIDQYAFRLMWCPSRDHEEILRKFRLTISPLDAVWFQFRVRFVSERVATLLRYEYPSTKLSLKQC